MKRSLLLSLLLVVFSGAFAQVGCNGYRYFYEIFSDVTVTADVPYGANVRYNGDSVDLKMDIYEPMGDTVSRRPLIVLAHGGSFVSGDKNNPSMVALGNAFARRGYVVASMQYRLGVNALQADSTELIRAVIRSVQDAKSAVRFFRKDATENGNSFRVDTSTIFIGGSSAGAVMAVHYTFIDDTLELPTYVKNIIASLGGIEGNTGNPGYSSRISACINLCGAVGELSWISPGEEPVVSVHGTNDDVVPYGSEMLIFLGLLPIKVVHGSGSIHPVLDQLGVPNALYTFQGAGHVPYEGNPGNMEITINFVRDFLYQQLCPGTSGLADELTSDRFSIYPNPAQDVIFIDISGEPAEFALFDMNGRMLRTGQADPGTRSVDVSGLSPGMYVLRLNAGGLSATRKIVLQ